MKKQEETYIIGIVQSVVNIYIDDVLLNPKYLTDFKKGCELFENNLDLESIPSQYIELQIHKKSGINHPKKIRIEYGVLVNNALTVAEVNKMLVCDFNKLQVKSLSKHNNSFEMIPIGLYNVDDYDDEDDNVINIKALDNIIKLDSDDGYYDASELIKKKGYATLGEIAEDICSKKGLELLSSSFLGSDKKITVYDNQIKARQYMGYIAEQAGCFCCADRYGKICFRSIGQDEENVPLRLFKNYKFGEENKISKVAYEDGTRSFKFGDDTGNTLWINQENIFIVDEEQIQNIYDKMKGLTINSFEGTVIINPAVDIGDKINIDGKTVIYQGEMTLNKRFIADINSKISIKAKQETTVRKESQTIINRRVQSRIDEAEGKITQLIEETTENSNKLSQHEQTIESITDTVSSVETKVETIEETANTAIENADEIKKQTIYAVDVMYALSNSSTEAPTTGWSTTAPEWENGKYMWQKTVITYGDGTTEETSVTCITGATGEKGENGTDGKDGADGQKGDTGTGVKEIVEQYYLSTSNTTQTGGSWKTTQDAWSKGKYIWTRNKITWTDDTVSYTTPILATGLNNANSVADNANTTANTANSTANSAKDTADEAKETADNAINQVTTTTQKLTQVEQTVDGITQTVSEVETKIETVETKADNAQETADNINTNLTQNYYTKSETNSQIQQTANSITSSVSASISEAKQEAIDSANSNTDDKLQDYSTTTEMNSVIEQKANEITTRIDEMQDITETVSGTKIITLENCVPGALLELHIYGNNQVFKYLYPSDDLYPSNNLYPYGDSRIIVSASNGETEETTSVDIYELGVTDVLRQNGTTKDEYVLKDGKAQVIRRINKDGTIKAIEEIEDLGEFFIELKDVENVIEIKNYSAEIEAKYAIQNDYTDIYATKVEMSSSIKQTSDEINLEVRKKVGKDEVISSINLSTEEGRN